MCRASRIIYPAYDSEICSLCLPTPRVKHDKQGSLVTITSSLSIGVLINTTEDGQLFNLSSLYRSNYHSSSSRHSEIWRVAVRSLLNTPVVSNVLSLLRRECRDSLNLILLKRDTNVFVCEHMADVYLHIGFLSFALLDLRLLDSDSVPRFHEEMGNFVTDTMKQSDIDKRLIIPLNDTKDAARDAEIFKVMEMVDRIRELAKTDGITVRGVSQPGKLHQPPWIQITRAYPTSGNDPILNDARMVLDIASRILYATLDSLLAKRAVMFPRRRPLGSSAPSLEDPQMSMRDQEFFTKLLSDT